MPRAAIHENGGADVTVDIRGKLPGKVEAGIDPGGGRSLVPKFRRTAYGGAVSGGTSRSPGHKAGQFARAEFGDTDRRMFKGAEDGFTLYPEAPVQGSDIAKIGLMY